MRLFNKILKKTKQDKAPKEDTFMPDNLLQNHNKKFSFTKKNTTSNSRTQSKIDGEL